MDRFNATKLGEPLPSLGRAISEDPEMTKQRKKGAKIDWSTDYVYTMALWSGKKTKHCIVFAAVILPSNIHNHHGQAYADWSDWQILNFPGIRPCECHVFMIENVLLGCQNHHTL
jgi:hypothetical protein